MGNRAAYSRVRSVLKVLLAVLPCFALGWGGSPAFAQPSVQGQWVAPPDGMGGFGYPWPLTALDATVLSTGKTLVWQTAADSAKLWNPGDGVFTDVPCSAPACNQSLWCTSHVFLSDGSLLVAGGFSSKETKIFRLSTNDWEQAADMAFNRFYPTATALPDGRVLMSGGSGAGAFDPEIYNPSIDQWGLVGVQTPGIAKQYPFMFVLPDGKIFYAGGGHGFDLPNPPTETYTLDIQNQVWTEFPAPPNNNSFFRGDLGAAVMYQPGKVLKCGGQIDQEVGPGLLTQQTAIIDTTAANPVWQTSDDWDMPEVRKNHYLVLLPDGKILLVGGHDGTEFVKDARMWDPQDPTPSWEDMADMQNHRGDHAVAVLLPDGTVLTAGSSATAEIYEPPYLHTGTAQPQIVLAPGVVEYGTRFVVAATSIADIDRVTLLRPGSTTHWFNSDQRFMELGFTVNGAKLLVDAPCSANFAPPGHYMMFVIDDLGVPSVATWIELIPNPCRADLNDDNDVDSDDLAILLGAWGPNPGHPADFTCDGDVGPADLAILLGTWGACGRGISSGTELINALVEMGYANVPEHTAWSTAATPEEVLASGQQLLELLGE